jgi:HYR domain
MHKRERSTLAVAVSLFIALTGSAVAQTFDLSITPSQFYQFETEVFLTVRGASLGSESTVVNYTQGDTTLSVLPQVDPDAPFLSDVWVPLGVTNGPGTWNVTVVATDTGGAQRVYGPATLTVIERPPDPDPPLNLPEVVVGEATSLDGGVVYFEVNANCDRVSGSFFPMGLTTVTCSAGTQTGSFAVVMTETVAPVISGAPGNITSVNPVVTWPLPTAVDNLDGVRPVTCEPPSGSTFPLGETIVQCYAADEHLNYDTVQFVVKIISTPILTLPDNIVAEATSAAGAVVTYTATAEGADGPVTCAPQSGSTFALGVTTVNCSATNAAGTSTGSFTVTVRDTIAPTIVSIDGTPREVLWPNNHKMSNITIVVQATDAVDSSLTSKVISITSDQPVNDGGDGDTAPDWAITGDLTIQLRSERTAGIDRHYTITVEVKDDSGNVSTGTLIIVVRPGG